MDTNMLSNIHSDNKIDLNMKANHGWTAFILACFNGHKDVVKLQKKMSNFENVWNDLISCSLMSCAVEHYSFKRTVYTSRGAALAAELVKRRETLVRFWRDFKWMERGIAHYMKCNSKRNPIQNRVEVSYSNTQKCERSEHLLLQWVHFSLKSL